MRSKKYFICSDLHSFYTPFKKALKEAGFNKRTKSHILVILGDIFDRGEETIPLYNFIKSLPKERRILIRGNHEYLLRNLYTRGYSLAHDEYNGTIKTLLHFIGLPSNYLTTLRNQFYKTLSFNNLCFEDKAYEDAYNEYKKQETQVEHLMYHNEFAQNILDWIASDEWVNYWETDRYIFVHSFIPLKQKHSVLDGVVFDTKYLPFDNWRTEATQEDWERATWGCPWRLYSEGLFQEGDKTLVCGHWHTSDFWKAFKEKEFWESVKNGGSECPIFKVDGIKLIGLDACTVATKEVNVLVLDEEEL